MRPKVLIVIVQTNTCKVASSSESVVHVVCSIIFKVHYSNTCLCDFNKFRIFFFRFIFSFFFFTITIHTPFVKRFWMKN